MDTLSIKEASKENYFYNSGQMGDGVVGGRNWREEDVHLCRSTQLNSTGVIEPLNLVK